MPETGEPKWERVEPPNFDEPETPKAKIEPTEAQPLDLNSEEVKGEVRRLLKAEHDLVTLMDEFGDATVRDDEGKVEFWVDPHQKRMTSYVEPITGVGFQRIAISKNPRAKGGGEGLLMLLMNCTLIYILMTKPRKKLMNFKTRKKSVNVRVMEMHK